jgi:hypothetical protein
LKKGELSFEVVGPVEATTDLVVSGNTIRVQIKGGVAELNNQKLIVLAE